MATLNEATQTLATQIKEQISVDNKTGMATAKDDLYTTTLPEGITKEVVDTVAGHNAKFVAASTLAFGQVAIDALKSNKALEQVEIDIPMAKGDNLGIVTQRQTTVTVPGTGEKMEKWGTTTAKITTKAGAGSSGQLGAARDSLKEYALAALKK